MTARLSKTILWHYSLDEVIIKCCAHLLRDRYINSYVIVSPWLAQGSSEMRTKLVTYLLCPYLQAPAMQWGSDMFTVEGSIHVFCTCFETKGMCFYFSPTWCHYLGDPACYLLKQPGMFRINPRVTLLPYIPLSAISVTCIRSTILKDSHFEHKT